MSTSTKQANTLNANPIDALNELLAAYTAAQPTPPNTRDMFMLALSAVHMGQRVLSGKSTPDLQQAVVNVIDSLAASALKQIQFLLMPTLLSQTYAGILTERGFTADNDRCRALLEALMAFLIVAQTSPQYATETVLRRIVENAQPTVAATVPYPELNYRANILKLFTPGAITAIDLEPLQIVVYKGELLGGGFGPELWGLAYTKDKEAHLLLETGEYIKVPETSLCLAVTKDYSTSELPPYLLACAKLFIPIMLGYIWGHNMPPDLQQAVERLDKHLGSFSLPPMASFVPAEEMAGCENVIDKARWGADDSKTGGVVKTISVDKACLQIVITAQQAAVRPYITATLLQPDTGAILMRLDTPREFTVCGVYLFPAGEKSVALIVL